MMMPTGGGHDIMNMQPTVLNNKYGDSTSFLGPIADSKGQLSSTIGVSVHSILWAAGSGCPFLCLGNTSRLLSNRFLL